MPDVYVDKGGEKMGVSVAGEKRDGRDPASYAELMREARTKNPFAAFVVAPKHLSFETQEKEEKILLLLRRHPLTNVPWILVALVMVVVPLLLPYFSSLAFLPVRLVAVSVVAWYLLVFGFIFEQFLDWYFNVYVITDERIIDFDFYSLIYKRVSEAKIDKSEDVTFEMTGVVRSIFNFGTIFIQTAGESREFEFEDTPRPQKVVKFLNELILEEEREQVEGRVR